MSGLLRWLRSIFGKPKARPPVKPPVVEPVIPPVVLPPPVEPPVVVVPDVPPPVEPPVPVLKPVAVATVDVTPATASLAPTETRQLVAIPKDSLGNPIPGRKVLWASSDLSLATVDATGLVRALYNPTPTPPPGGGDWPNEPAGFTVRDDYGWTDVLETSYPGDHYIPGANWGYLNGGNASRISDPTAPFSPPYVLQLEYPNGMEGGVAPATLWYDLPGPNAPEIYIGFWLKVSNPWQGHGSGVNKIAFITSGAINDAAAMPTLYGAAAPYYLRSQIAESGTEQNPAYGGWLNQNVANPEFTLGVSHLVEIYLKYGTSSTSYNGIQKMWLDEALVMNYSDINYREDGINGWKFSPTWGGAGGVKTQTDFFWIDHAHTSTP